MCRPVKFDLRVQVVLFMWISLLSTPGLTQITPDIVNVLDVPVVADPKVSSHGDLIYTVAVPDWEANRFDTEIYLSGAGQAPVALTDNPAGSSTDPRWSPDGRHIGFQADRGEGTQVYRVSVEGGEPQAITAWPGGLMSFEFSPDGRHMALLLVDWPDPAIAAREEEFGEFEVVGEAPYTASLWLVDIERAIAAGGAGPGSIGGPGDVLYRLAGGPGMSVSVFSVDGFLPSYSFSPDGASIVFSHGDSMSVMDSIRSNISLVEVATGAVRTLVDNDSWDETPLFSPDGTEVLFTRTVLENWLADKQLLVVPVSGGSPRRVEVDHPAADTNPLLLDWTDDGISVIFQARTDQHVWALDPANGQTHPQATAPAAIGQFSISRDGRHKAWSGYDGTTPTEVYWQRGDDGPRRISRINERIQDWLSMNVETVTWTAEDGVEIEGIVYSPPELDRDAPAPLIIVLHGGPRAAEHRRRVHDQEYPVQQWVAQGARVLFPNYRGSTAYGYSFRTLTMGNIGLAESKDVISAVEFMNEAGLVADQRIGIAGHSWGGYLSAFLSASTDRFCVASVGAGITDNRINYVLSAAGVAKEGYLASYPWKQPALWDRTSPVHYLGRASTPTLIQHGDNDQVVPVANAREFHQGLSDMGVPVKTVIFRNSGHNIDRPREKRAWLQQNLDWFNTYLWQSTCAERNSG